MSIRGNRLRERLDEKQVLIGCFLSFPDPRVVEYLGIAGFDWVLIDGEHEGVTTHSVYGLLQAAEATNLATVVRAPSSDATTLMAFADAGADAVLVPHVTGADEARRIVSALRYPPEGTRGAAASSRAAGYGLLSGPVEYFTDPTRHTLASVLLEDVEAYDNLDEIAVVDGLSVVCMGSGDLAGSLGIPGQAGDPRVHDLIDRGLGVFARNQIPVSIAVGSREAMDEAIHRGVRMPMVSVGGLMKGAIRDLLDS